jgi:hypothetical protein
MIPSLRSRFNCEFTREKYLRLQRTMKERCAVEVPFRMSETPCFFPQAMLESMAMDGEALIRQLVDNPEYRERSEASLPAQFRVPNESPHPMFIQVDFGLVRERNDELKPKLVELQAFPSLYGYQAVLAQSYIDVFELDRNLKYLLSGLDESSYVELLRRAILAGHHPENVVLLEIDPQHQKTLPDFLVTEKMLGIPTVCITSITKEGKRLFYDRDGKKTPVERIYNRAIVDELERKGVSLGFDFRDELEVEWAGHPNWYFRISKYSIPYLRHESVPETRFLDELKEVPDDLTGYVLKPLYSFAGLGVIVGPKKEDLEAILEEKRSQYILQERVSFEPLIETPFGKTKAEVRVMYIWLESLLPVTTIIRMGRGLQMGVDHNRNMEWVGSSAGLFL